MSSAEDASRLFEAGFMLGVIRAIGTLPTPPASLAYYQEQRAGYAVTQIVDRFRRDITDPVGREAAAVLARHYLTKGHLSGYTFFQEYLQSLTARWGEGEWVQQQARRHLEIRYWQCSLLGSVNL